MQSLGIALGHGVDYRQDKITNHDNHQFFKYPGEPVFPLKRQNRRRRRMKISGQDNGEFWVKGEKA